jgi:hypothetical protein
MLEAPQSNSESVETHVTLAGNNQPRGSNAVEDRSTGGVALPAVSPLLTASILTDSHRSDARWDDKPEISNTGFLRARAEEVR